MFVDTDIVSYYSVVGTSAQTLQVYEISWAGTFKYLYDISFNITTPAYTLTPTDFLVLGNRLFVVLNEIN